MLVLGLAIGLVALVRTNRLFTDTISALYIEERAASDRATKASDKSTLAEDRADKAEEQAAEAIDRAGKNEKEAARLNKVAEDERTARIKIQTQLAWRELKDVQVDMIRDRILPFSGQEFDMVTFLSEPECLNLSNHLYRAALTGKWILDPS